MDHPRSGLRPHPLEGAPPADRQSRIRGGHLVYAAAFALLTSGAAQAQLFPDNEARKAIVELRAADEAHKKQLADLAASGKELGAANKDLAEQLTQLKRSLLDLNNQLEALRADLARQRGSSEQLARDVAELQRRQKDIAQGVDERMRKIEPQRVKLDGKDFLADAEEKRQYDEAMALMRAGEFNTTASALGSFLRRWPESGYADTVRFWLGNAQYGKRDLKEAMATFRSFIADAPTTHPRQPEAMLALANAQAESKDSKGARATLGELIKKYPQSEAAQAGKERLAALPPVK